MVSVPKLFPYQSDGADFLNGRRNALLNWEPGCGKTATAVAAWDKTAARKVLVLCPAIGKHMWEREVARWGKPRTITVLKGRTAPLPKLDEGLHVVIANYDLLAGRDSYVFARLAKIQWDVLVLDEAHFLKNPGTDRTKRVFGKNGLAFKADRVWALTGTPAPNHYGELYAMIRALFPHAITRDDGTVLSRERFEDTYCKVAFTPWGRKVTGSQNGTELAAKLKPFMSSLKKKDVLADLPPLLFDVLPLSPDDLPPEARKAAVAASEALMEVMESNPTDDLLDAMRKASLHLGTERRLIGLAKAELVANLVKSELTADAKAKRIIFAHHSEVIDVLKSSLSAFQPGVIDGRTTSYNRALAEQRFQTDPACRVIICQITAGGTVITLTASRDVVFAESSWTPGDNYQAACRAHRVGQHDAVLARMVCLSGTVDERIMAVCASKTAELAELFG